MGDFSESLKFKRFRNLDFGLCKIEKIKKNYFVMLGLFSQEIPNSWKLDYNQGNTHCFNIIDIVLSSSTYSCKEIKAEDQRESCPEVIQTE